MSHTLIRARRAGAALLASAALTAVSLGAALGAPVYPDAANKALEWVKTQQQPDGSFAGFGAGSTVDAALAIVAAGQDPASYSKGGKSAVDFLESKAAEVAKTPGGAGKLLLAVSAMGKSGKQFGGTDVVAALNTSYDAQTGRYGKDAIGHAFALLGLKAAGERVPEGAVAALKSLQGPEGGWAFTGDTKAGAADTNTTAVAVQALIATGVAPGDAAVTKAVAYLKTQQNSDGGFPYQKGGEFGSDSDVNSTAYAAQALSAAGTDTSAPLAFILSMQMPSGAFQWKKSETGENAGATYQAIPALLGATLARTRTIEQMQGPGGTATGGGKVETPAGQTGGSAPGMPRTGSGDGDSEGPIAAIAAVAGLLFATGLTVRRRAAL